MSNDEIDRLVRERDEARRSRDFARADAIRNQLAGLREGDWRIALLDEPGGTSWYWTQSKP